MKKLIFSVLCVLGGVWGPMYTVYNMAGETVVSLEVTSDSNSYEALCKHLQSINPTLVRYDSCKNFSLLFGTEELNSQMNMPNDAKEPISITLVETLTTLYLDRSYPITIQLPHEDAAKIQNCFGDSGPAYLVNELPCNTPLKHQLRQCTEILLSDGTNQITLTANIGPDGRRYSPYQAFVNICKHFEAHSCLSTLSEVDVAMPLNHSWQQGHCFWAPVFYWRLSHN